MLASSAFGANQADNNGAAPFNTSAQNGHENIVEELLEVEADANKASDSGSSPLYSVSQNGYENIVEKLLAAKADINKTKTDGRT